MDEAAILDLLLARNKKEKLGYDKIIHNYNILMKQNGILRSQNDQFQKEMIILRHELQAEEDSSPAGNGSSPIVSKLQQKIQKLQDELTTKYRIDIEGATSELQLAKDLRKTEAKLSDVSSRLEAAEEALATTRASAQEEADRNARLVEDAAFLREELNSLRRILRETEEKEQKTAAENTSLVNKILSIKEESMNEINEMNDTIMKLHQEIDNLKKEKGKAEFKLKNPFENWGKKDEDVKEGGEEGGEEGPLGAATEAAWARFQVTIPTRAVHTLKAHGGEAYDAVGDRSSVASAGSDGAVKLWEAGTGMAKTTLRADQAPVVAVDMIGDVVAGASTDRTGFVWSAASGRRAHHLQGHGARLHAVRLFPGARTVLTASGDRCVKVWDIAREMCACTTTLRATSSCNAADVAPDGAAVLTGHQDGGLRFWDVRSGAKVNDIKSLHQSQITSVMYSPDNASTILTNSRDNTLKLVDARTYEVITTMSHPSYRTSYNWSRTTFSPNGAYAAAGSGDGSVFVFDVYDGSVKTILTHHRSAVSSCYWSSSQLMSCDREGFLTLWS